MPRAKPRDRTNASGSAVKQRPADVRTGASRGGRWLSFLGGLIGLAVLGRIVAGLDHGRLRFVLTGEPRLTWSSYRLPSLASSSSVPGLAVLGFIVILAHLARVPGGFFIGAVFVRGRFGVGEERAVAMVMVVVASATPATGVVGALTLRRHGVALGELTTRQVPGDGPA